MNPSKKILIPKNNSPWLLCSSKSFPGKFYYFNGSTGETAWCLSETDKNVKKGTVPKVTEKSDTYPEPVDPPVEPPIDPPVDHSTTTSCFLSQNNADNTEFRNANSRPTPAFGQAVFPKYVPPSTPKFVWALTPMYMPSPLPHNPERIIQTYDQPIFVPNSSNDVQQLNANFTRNGFQFQKQPFQSPMFVQTANMKPFELSMESQTLNKPFMKDEACQTFVPIQTKSLGVQPSESDTTPKSLNTSRSVENLSTLITKDVEMLTLNPPHKVDNKTSKLSKLDKNDLRFKLVAKKRQLECTTESERAGTTAGQSTAKTRKVLTPRKQVTFDIQESGASHASSENIKETNQSPESSRMEELRLPTRNLPWYVVADTEALLEDLRCIEDYVKNDALCRLLVPHAVYSELELRSRGHFGSLAARQLLRKLVLPPSHIVVQSNPGYGLSTEDSILQCCWSLSQEDRHVVLVSNDINMLNKAKSMHLECYTLHQIKIINQNAAEPRNDLKKLKISVGSDKNKSENIFLQNLSEVNGLRLPTPNVFRSSDAKMSIFDAELNSGSEFSKKDDDKLINLTKSRSTVNTVFNSKINNLKDQIIKLNIADSTHVNNRTKQIMDNVFWTTELDNKIDQTTSVDIKKYNRNMNLEDKNKLNSNNQIRNDVPENLGNIDKIDQDIRRINVTDKIGKSSDTIKVSGIIKLNNQFNLDEDLERFCIKTTMVENRVNSRLDEWMCRLFQTMEGVLTKILLTENTNMKRLMPPWNLFEAIQAAGEAFKKQPYLKLIIDRFSIKLLTCSSNNGKFKQNMKSNDFMELVGLSMILIDHLKEIVNCTELFEADDMLVDLIKNIEDPETDIDLSLEKINTPVVSRSEMPDDKAPAGFRKSRTDIEEYLKKHFATWQTHEADKLIENVNDKILNEEPNVVRTCGKNLNTVKLNNAKAITVENKADRTDGNNQLKVIRNVKIKSAFEEILINKAEVDVDQLDYEANKTVNVTVAADDKNNKENNEMNHLSDNTVLDDDLFVSASSITSECARAAYPMVKMFLVKLKRTLVRISDFVYTNIQGFKNMSMDKKDDILRKAELTHQYVLKIIERLQSIITRESGEGKTLKDLLIKSGECREDDPEITNYRQTITKFLNQTQTIKEALEHMLSLRNAVSAKEKKEPNSDFHNTSPILPSRVLRSSVTSAQRVVYRF